VFGDTRNLVFEMISPLTCPTCSKKIVLEGNRSMPFCSERCRLIDLGRWLDEEIGVPVEPSGQQQQEDEGADDS